MVNTSKFLTILSDGIRSLVSAVVASTGLSDANKLIATNSIGKVDSSFLPSVSNIDPTLAINASTGCRIFEEFITGVGSWGTTASGTGTHAGITTPGNVVDVGGHPGICYFTTGSTSTGYARIGGVSGDNLNRLLLGFASWSFEGSLQIPVLRTSTEEFSVLFGFSDVANTSFIDAVTFLYNLNDSNWRCLTAINSSVTIISSGVPVTTGWVKLKIKIDTSANNVDFYINDVLVNTSTVNIPKGTNRQLCPQVGIFKFAGTSQRTALLDYTDLIGIFNTLR